MTFFEFLMVLIGLVGAIALSTLLTYLGHIIRNWPQVENPMLFLLLSAWMILNVIGHLSGIWAYRFVDLEVHFSSFVIIAPVIFFTLATTTLIPSTTTDNKPINLDLVYFASSPSVFLLLAIHVATALGADYLPGVTGAPPALFMIIMIAMLLIGMITKHKPTHLGLLILLMASQAMPMVIQAFNP
jgi:hypothetical protein